MGGMPLHGEYAPSPVDAPREQAELYERTNGAEGNELQGKPIIVLTTLGAKSGKIRKTPLMRVEHDGQYLVVASKGGAPEHPTWYHNIVDAPLVELQDGSVRKDYTPRELAGDERALWWDRAVEAWPAYADYAQKTDRLIPVFLLTPVE
jgi:deazaflavin-dependent oxidoreductase (nitroreductase family)